MLVGRAGGAPRSGTAPRTGGRRERSLKRPTAAVEEALVDRIAHQVRGQHQAFGLLGLRKPLGLGLRGAVLVLRLLGSSLVVILAARRYVQRGEVGIGQTGT